MQIRLDKGDESIRPRPSHASASFVRAAPKALLFLLSSCRCSVVLGTGMHEVARCKKQSSTFPWNRRRSMPPPPPPCPLRPIRGQGTKKCLECLMVPRVPARKGGGVVFGQRAEASNNEPCTPVRPLIQDHKLYPLLTLDFQDHLLYPLLTLDSRPPPRSRPLYPRRIITQLSYLLGSMVFA